MKKIFPIGHTEESMKLHDDIAKILMDFVCHNQKPFSKKLNSFIATGAHDMRAGLVSVEILRKIEEYLGK